MPEDFETPTILKQFQKFIGFSSDLYKYLHNTQCKEIARTIIREGLEFERYLENTTDLILSVDLVRLKYFNYVRGSYGNYTVVVEISKSLEEKYSQILDGTGHHFTEVLIKKIPCMGSNDELVYTLCERFVKGYFNQENGENKLNPKFNPYYDTPFFEEMAEYIKSIEL